MLRQTAALWTAVLCTLGMIGTWPTLAAAATFWTGPPVTFSKAAFTNAALPENQDRITPTAWITRGFSSGLFNAALESAYAFDVSPLNTEWAPGSISDGVGTLTFSDWRTAVGGDPPGTLNQPFVLHLLDDDIYIDVTFLSWGVGTGAGGSFSYERSTPPASVPGLSRPGAALLALVLCGVVAAGRRWR